MKMKILRWDCFARGLDPRKAGFPLFPDIAYCWHDEPREIMAFGFFCESWFTIFCKYQGVCEFLLYAIPVWSN